MKIAIIGAGPTGLICEKYALEQGFECDVFEQTGILGGTWSYTDRVGVDDNGLPIHSSMYKGLRTNLPKEAMAILDFPYPQQDRSYITQPEVVNYFNNFADQFNLRTHIKYYKCVTKVKPLPHKKWTVTIQDAKTKIEESNNYDAVFVCNGHYRDPIIPEIPGQGLFKGTQIHSHSYRIPEPFENKRVLVIGAGPSGQDISVLISKVAEHARFALAALAGKFTLPSKEDMLKALVEYMRERKDRGISQRHAHKLGGSEQQKAYFQDLAETAGIRNIPLVVTKLYEKVKMGRNLEDCFKIIDDENFIQIA